jgi:putative two-component system response regulator
MTSEPLLHRMKILIVDDEPVNVAVLEDILKDSGYARIRSLTDSRETTATCAEYEPDLILLDLMMPYIDGFTILESIRAGNAMAGFLPVLILTADMSQETKRRALKCGATDFLLKPFDQVEVLLRIHNLLHWRKSHLLLDNQRAAL